MKITFWLLDINSKSNKDSVELCLWGIDNQGNRVLVVDRNFIAYFYVVIKDGFKSADVAAKISNAYALSIVKTELTERKFFGKPVNALKVYCKKAEEMSKLAREFRKLQEVKDCLEDDIRLPMRYIIDNEIVPCAWHQADISPQENIYDSRVDNVYLLEAPPKPIDIVKVPVLRVLGFSMIYYSREGSPKPDRNPALIISTVSSAGEEKQFILSESKDDKPIIEKFADYLRLFDPDVVVSYGANSVDWSYFKGRTKKLKSKFNVDRAQNEPHTSVYGHVSLTGIANVDLADFVDMFPEVKVKTLWNLSEHLGIKTASSVFIDDVEFADYWDDQNKRKELLQFGMDSAKRVMATANLLLDFAMQLSSLVSLPLDHVMTAAVGFRVEWFLIKQAPKTGELVPKRIEQPYRPYVGGLVLKPKSGLHSDIAVLDFNSMYPNIMIRYNLSPDTYVPVEEPDPPSGVYEAPEVKHRFRKAPPGFYNEALTFLINVRSQIRKEIKMLNPKTTEYQILDARQKAVKIITNASYGYAGWVGARWYAKPVAEAASAWGRNIILKATQMAENKGLTVIYGDTDSLFITFDETKTIELQKEIKNKLDLDVEIGKIYKRLFFTEAKKRYAGLQLDGIIDIVGLEVIRGDWAEVARRVQEKVLQIILSEQSPKNAVNYVHKAIMELRQRKVPFQELIIWKTLTKPAEEYAVKAPHVEAARMLKERGWRLTGGDKVGYVVLKGKGRLYSRVKPYVFAKYNDVDVEYYVTNQIVPAATRILRFFRITENELLSQKEEIKNLLDFMKA